MDDSILIEDFVYRLCYCVESYLVGVSLRISISQQIDGTPTKLNYKLVELNKSSMNEANKLRK
jgi:hypothetical protein